MTEANAESGDSNENDDHDVSEDYGNSNNGDDDSGGDDGDNIGDGDDDINMTAANRRNANQSWRPSEAKTGAGARAGTGTHSERRIASARPPHSRERRYRYTCKLTF
eukprot:GHVU01038202.1.p8 GENE.GHVU01038202.1~~GHVU01038202.1.p8  ORF type:complete len:107 (+),score=19.97 GHVU01038202.1:1886-2206(+)